MRPEWYTPPRYEYIWCWWSSGHWESRLFPTAAASSSQQPHPIQYQQRGLIASHRIDPLIDHREISAQLPSLPLHLVHQLEQQQQQTTTIIIKFINYNDNRTTAAADCRRFHLESCKMHTIHITFRYRYTDTLAAAIKIRIEVNYLDSCVVSCFYSFS